jgi:hypothetical protein
MFSIINTGLVQVLVWFSPGSRAVSTLAPPSAQPICNRDGIPAAALVLPQLLGLEAMRAGPEEAGTSHTPTGSDARESSHTQEFTDA